MVHHGGMTVLIIWTSEVTKNCITEEGIREKGICENQKAQGRNNGVCHEAHCQLVQSDPKYLVMDARSQTLNKLKLPCQSIRVGGGLQKGRLFAGKGDVIYDALPLPRSSDNKSIGYHIGEVGVSCAIFFFQAPSMCAIVFASQWLGRAKNI